MACGDPGTMEFGGDWWSLELAPGWSGQHDPECATILREGGAGAFQVSAARKDGEVSDDDLLDFASELPDELEGLAVQHGSFTGFRYRFEADGRAWDQWFLRSGSTVVFATYNCPVADRGAEDADVASMLDSLVVRRR